MMNFLSRELSVRDRGGRRSGIDRRQFSYDACIPERRSGLDRRSGEDRRSDMDRRRIFHIPVNSDNQRP